MKRRQKKENIEKKTLSKGLTCISLASGKERNIGTKAIFEEIISRNVPELMTDTNSQFQELNKSHET